MPKHLWVLACCWIGYGAAVGSLATAGALWYFSSSASAAEWLLALAVLGLAGVVGGIALLGGQRWARALLMVLAVPSLVVFPVGTALGAYTIWFAIRMGLGQSQQQGGSPPHSYSLPPGESRNPPSPQRRRRRRP